MALLACGPVPPNAGEKALPQETLFTLMDSSVTGIGFVNTLLETEDWNILWYEYLFNGGGVAAGDINNDGLVDLYFVSNSGADRLYLNKGDLKFDDISARAGIDQARGHKSGVTMADINGDGLLDIHVCRTAIKDPESRRNLVYINNGDLTFTEQAAALGLDDASFSTQAYFFDMDLDGDLDMYLLNHPPDMKEANNIRVKQTPAGTLVISLSEDLTYASDRLYRNENGRFKDITRSAGILNEAFGLSAIVSDFNGDRIPDIYVCNDYTKPDQLFIALGNGKYQDRFDDYFEHGSFSAMGSDLADINNDGSQDLMTADMTAPDRYRFHTLGMIINLDKFNKMTKVGLGAQFSANCVQLNNGNGTFSDISYLTGMAYTDWSWSPLLADFDNDGNKDVWVSNGYVRDVTNNDYRRYEMDRLQRELNSGNLTLTQWLASIPSVKIRSYFFRNEGALAFSDRSLDWNSGPPAFSNGSAYADLDNDGYLDVVTNNLNDPAFILHNNGSRSLRNGFIRFHLDAGKGLSASGAKVIIRLADGGQQVQEIRAERGFLSSSEPIAHFGLGEHGVVEQVEVIWPDGGRQVIQSPTAGLVHRIQRDSVQGPVPTAQKGTPLFVDRSSVLPASLAHAENPYNDFKREPLLYHRMSQNGPAIAVADVNGDGLDDIFLGGAMDHPGKLFLQRNGEFAEVHQQAFVIDQWYEDVSAVFFDADGDGDRDLFVGSGGNERPRNDPAYADRLYTNNGSGIFTRSVDAIPKVYNSNGCAVPFDFDGDGDLDLFVGSRSTPGRFPLQPSHQLLRNDRGRFVDATAQWSEGLQFTGMLTDAMAVDLDKDGIMELVLAGDWMPISVFKIRSGRLVNATKEFGLSDRTGWWCSLDIGDLDGDGYPEILAGNLGLNSAFTASEAAPMMLYHKDFDGNGTEDAVLCSVQDGRIQPVAMRDQMLDQMIMLKKRFLRYSTYATADLKDIFTGPEMKDVGILTANTFAHTLFRNNAGKGFIPEPLPREAQLSMAQAMMIVDADGDGANDLIVAGNMFGSDVQFGRYDAGIGLFMKGDGHGALQMVPAKESGLLVRGNVRHMARITVDGKPHLLVVRNNDRCGLIRMNGSGVLVQRP